MFDEMSVVWSFVVLIPMVEKEWIVLVGLVRAESKVVMLSLQVLIGSAYLLHDFLLFEYPSK
jgi:hypothetical protein